MQSTVTNPDGTETPMSGGPGHMMLPAIDDAVATEIVDPLFLAQVAVAKVLGGAPVVIYDGDAWIKGTRLVADRTTIARVTLDHPKPEQDLQGVSITIVEGAGGTAFGEEYSVRRFLDEGMPAGIVGEYYGDAKVALEVRSVLTHNDERRGVRAAIVGALMGEPAGEWLGRVILIGSTDLAVRLTLDRVSSIDGDQTAQENIRAVVAEITAEVPIIRLTRMPARIHTTTAASLE